MLSSPEILYKPGQPDWQHLEEPGEIGHPRLGNCGTVWEAVASGPEKLLSPEAAGTELQ